MSEPTLKETEEFLISLWTKRAFCQDDTPDKNTSDSNSQTLDQRGISVYAKILKLNHLQVMEEIFPRTARLAGKHWESLALAYFNWRLSVPDKPNPDNKNYSLNHIGDAFYDFLLDDFALPKKSLLTRKHPYLADLSQYEIIQKALLDYSCQRQFTPELPQLEGKDFSTHGPIINPHARIFYSDWDISQLLKLIDAIPPTEEEIEPLKITHGKLVLLAMQNQNTGNIKLIELNDLTALMIKSAMVRQNSYAELLSIACDHSLMPKEKLMDCCLQLFLDLKEQEIIIGDQKLLRKNNQ